MRFSALQRAENSSIGLREFYSPSRAEEFQCSSASRKFLNERIRVVRHTIPNVFQCSSASRKFLNAQAVPVRSQVAAVSVLFSEPKIPQLFAPDGDGLHKLFRFQCSSASRKFLNSSTSLSAYSTCSFQCSSASRKFLNALPQTAIGLVVRFQCSSASRKFLNPARRMRSPVLRPVSVLFSEPKIPQSVL